MLDKSKTPARRPGASSQTHRNEFPAGYSLASCSPAELASAFPTTHDFATIKSVSRADLSGRFVSNFAAVSKRTAVHQCISFRRLDRSTRHAKLSGCWHSQSVAHLTIGRPEPVWNLFDGPVAPLKPAKVGLKMRLKKELAVEL